MRYADDVVRKEANLLDAFDLTQADDLEDVLANEDFEGYVELRSEGVELISDRVGTLLAYPFRAVDLLSLARELGAAA